MDSILLKMSVDYHGPTLVESLAEEQPNVALPHTRRPLSHGRLNRRPSEDTFQQKLAQLIARKADLLFVEDSGGQHRLKRQHVEDDKCCAVVAPLETGMQIMSSDRKLHFLQCLQKGDIVMGAVSTVQDSGLLITLFCLDGGKARDIDELNITAFCPVSELPRYYAHEGPLEAFTIKDRVRGVVLNVVPAQDNIVVSLKPNSLPAVLGHIKLGLIDDDDLPLHYRRIVDVDEGSYSRQLQASSGCNNPHSVDYLSDMFGLRVNPAPSLMRGLHGVTYTASDYKEPLRKAQSHRLASKSVAEGVTHFKAGRHIEAMQHLNKALQIDDENVDALVARGALYANNDSYGRAIDDFTAALKLNPRHKNARIYTCETLVAHAKSLADSSRTEEAICCLEQALELNPHMEEARITLHQLQSRLARTSSGASSDGSEREMETREAESEQEDDRVEKGEMRRMSATLRKLIEEDKQTKSKYKSRPCPDRDTSLNERRSSSGCKKRKKHRRHDSEDESPPKRGRHSSSSDTESDTSSSSSVESKMSPVTCRSRAEGEIVPDTQERRNLRNKARPPSADNGRAKQRQPSGVDTAAQGYRGHHSPVDKRSSSGRRTSVDSSKRRHEDRDLDGNCTKGDESHDRRRSLTHRRDSDNERSQSRRQVAERKPQSTERQSKQTGFGSGEKSRAFRGRSTRQSSQQNHRSAVEEVTETGKSCSGESGKDGKGSGDSGKGKGSKRESLDDMENFLKMLKQKKKEQMGGGKATTT